MPPEVPSILWFRRDLRLAGQPMLSAAAATGRPLLPVFILDPETESIAAAAKWRQGLAIAAFAEALAGIGLCMTLRRGSVLAVLRGLAAESGSGGVWWSHLYDPVSAGRDREVTAALKADGQEARTFPGHLLHEPWEIATGQGGPYRVFTPYWKAMRQRPVPAVLPPPGSAPAPGVWPASDRLEDWRLFAAMNRAAAVVLRYQAVGEAAARRGSASFWPARSRVMQKAEKLDPAGSHRARSLAEKSQGAEVLRYFDAVPRAWGLDPGQVYPVSIIPLAEGRERAFRAFGAGNT